MLVTYLFMYYRSRNPSTSGWPRSVSPSVLHQRVDVHHLANLGTYFFIRIALDDVVIAGV
jgi:hypothetical protein